MIAKNVKSNFSQDVSKVLASTSSSIDTAEGGGCRGFNLVLGQRRNVDHNNQYIQINIISPV